MAPADFEESSVRKIPVSPRLTPDDRNAEYSHHLKSSWPVPSTPWQPPIDELEQASAEHSIMHLNNWLRILGNIFGVFPYSFNSKKRPYEFKFEPMLAVVTCVVTGVTIVGTGLTANVAIKQATPKNASQDMTLCQASHLAAMSMYFRPKAIIADVGFTQQKIYFLLIVLINLYDFNSWQNR
jgi:hypothetical protein